ncbi:hypothetical protein D1872_321340 [compost metagenome]
MDRPREATVADLNTWHHVGQITNVSCGTDCVIIVDILDFIVGKEGLSHEFGQITILYKWQIPHLSSDVYLTLKSQCTSQSSLVHRLSS